MRETDKECPRVVYVPALTAPQADGNAINLLEILDVLCRGKWFIAGFTLACTLTAVLVTLFVLPVTYRSSAVLIPAAASQDSANSNLAGLAAKLPIPISFPLDEKTNSIMAFLESRNLKERLIRKYDLLPRLYSDLWNATKQTWEVGDPKDKPSVILAIQQKALEDIYEVSQNKDNNLISITWVDADPAFAAQMLGHVIAELQYFLDNEYETDAERERVFVEKQLNKATADLEYWEQQIPSQELTLAKIQRERLAAQTVYTELRKQLELAKITEAKNLVRFKVLDAPFIPVKKYQPKRALICGMVLVASFILALFLVLGRQALLTGKSQG